MKIPFNPKNITKYWKNQRPPDIESLKKSKTQYKDPFFPPNENSLLSKDSMGNFTDPKNGPSLCQEFIDSNKKWNTLYEWKSTSELPDKWFLFDENLDFEKVFQGNLGDCYLIGAIKSLAKYPYLIREKFRYGKYSSIGYYEIVLFIDGQWQIVIVDDYFPYRKDLGRFVCAYSQNKTLWIMLLEKAWAKINGGYTNIIGGTSREPLTLLTSFPSEILTIREENNDIDFFHKIENALHKGAIITISGTENLEIANQINFSTFHCYSIIGVDYWKERNIYLLKVVDPRGISDYCGDWGNSSNKWTEEMKKRFNYYPKANSKEFYMDLNTIMNIVNTIIICYPMYDAYIKSLTFTREKFFKTPLIFNISVSARGDLSVSIFFKEKRFNRNIKELRHPTSLVIFKYNKDHQIENFYEEWEEEENIHLTKELEEGNYILWLYCAYEHVNYEEKQNFHFSVVIRSLVEFKEEYSRQDNNFNLIYNFFANYFNNVERKNIGKYSSYSGGISKKIVGLIVIVYSNLLPKDRDKNFQNVEADIIQHPCFFNLPPNQYKTKISFDLPPMETRIVILMKHTRLSNSQALKLTNNPSWKRINNVPQNEDFQEDNNDILKSTILESSQLMESGILLQKYKEISIEKAFSIPEFQLEDTLMKTTRFHKKTQIEVIKEKRPYEMELLQYNFCQLQDCENMELEWNELQGNNWKYWGEIESFNREFHGRGILEFKQAYTYIGYFKNGKYAGGMFVKQGNIIFKGGFYKGKKHGFGTNYWDNNYEQGYYDNDKKEGIFFLYFDKSSNGYRVEYHNNQEIRKTKLSITEMKKMKEENKKKENIFVGCNDKVGNLANNIFIKDEENHKNIPQNNENNQNPNKPINNQPISNPPINNQPINNIPINNNENIYSNQNEIIINEQKQKFVKQIYFFMQINPFMIQQFLMLHPLNINENLDIIFSKDGNTVEYIGSIENKKKHGRGVYWNGHYYYAGYFCDDSPKGYFFIYNKDKIIKYKGKLNGFKVMKFDGNYYNMNQPQYKKKYIKVNNHNYAILKSLDESTGCYLEQNGQLHGEGISFTKKGIFFRDVIYENGIVIYSGDRIENYKLAQMNSEFHTKLNQDKKKLFEQIIKLPLQQAINPNELKWKILSTKDKIFIGECFHDKPYGRAFMFYNMNENENKRERYFGYFKDGKRHDKGKIYGLDNKRRYEGSFYMDKKEGNGIQYNSDGSTYYGYFHEDNTEGFGVLVNTDDTRIEGYFTQECTLVEGYKIDINNSQIQKLSYDISDKKLKSEGNIINCKDGEFRKKRLQQENELSKEFLEKIKLINSIQATSDSNVLQFGIIYSKKGTYIGEINQIGFKHGRGVLVNNITNEAYFGYFKHDMKDGRGSLYREKKTLYYNGMFLKNKMCGKGKFLFSDKSTLEGEFNNIGEGEGIMTFPTQEKLKGKCYGWELKSP